MICEHCGKDITSRLWIVDGNKRYHVLCYQQDMTTVALSPHGKVIPRAAVEAVIEELEERRDAGIGKRVTYNFVIHRLQALLPKEE